MCKLQNEKKQTQQGSRSKGIEQRSTQLYDVIALNCCTVDERGKPFFFLFSDIDSKDKYNLSRILKFFAFNNLSFYWFETSKGYHVISPCLLKMEEWYRLRRGLKLVENGYYEGINIRLSPKNNNDFKNGKYDFQYAKPHVNNTGYAESLPLNAILLKRCNSNLIPESMPRDLIKTKLNFSVYKEIEIEGVQY